MKHEHANDRAEMDGTDSPAAAIDKGYDLAYFARVHALSKEQAESLIGRVGNDRRKLDAAAEKLNGRFR